MTSRPALLLQKQLYNLERLLEKQESLASELDLIWGIEVSLVNGSIFHWQVALSGLFNSQWQGIFNDLNQGGIFQVDVIFDENYDSQPPYVSFVTIPFHPNIDMNTGCPCMDALMNWNPRTSIIELMVELQVMLSEPVIEGCVNGPAGEIFSKSPRLYNQMILDSIIASRRVQAGLDPFESLIQEEPSVVQVSEIKPSLPEKKAIKHLSFDHYHEQWLNLATSVKPNDNEQFFSIRKEQKELLQTHKYLLYGKFNKSDRSARDLEQKKRNRLEHFKKLYQKPEPVPVETTAWEIEAQELLEWTRSLATD